MRCRSLMCLLLPLLGGGVLANEPWLGQSVPIVPDVYRPSPSNGVDPQQAERDFALAQQAADTGDLSRAFELATLAVLADPDHAAARAVLGYQRVGDEWLTPYQAKQRQRGFRWSADFGWLRADEAPRYAAGERRVGRRWISASADAEARQAIADGWAVRTDHFVVVTNHSLERGTRLAAELETLFQIWRQTFPGYWLEEREVRALFAGERNARKRSRPMQVSYHRDKAGYVAHLKRRQPRIAQTLGIYFDDAREAHFYHSDDPAEADQLRATLYHEAAHQLFAENGPGRRGAGRDANYWLVEGAACYFELLAPVEGQPRYTLGDPAQGRLPSAVVAGPALPLAELATLGQSDLQRLPDLPAVYAQATGVVAMLRHGEHADTDREALVRTLRGVYGGRPDGDELARQTGRPWADLDRQYGRFLRTFRPEPTER